MHVIINGNAIEAHPGQTIYQAAKANGIFIPTLCYTDKTGPASKCRVCVVNVDGMRGLQTACSVQVQEGMEITTQSPEIHAAQESIVNLLLASGEHNCLSCEKNGRCELQDVAYYLGIDKPSIQFANQFEPADTSSPFIMIDRKKCISCGRCVEACNNVVVNNVLDMGFRGRETKVICDDDKPMGASTCVQCGECVQLCPVGAIVDKKALGKARAWETRTVRTTCPYCGVGCQLDLHVKGEQITRVTGVEDAEPNKGRLCVKGRFGYDFIYSKDRLTTPLIKENGEFRKASWDEAFTLIAKKFKEVIAQDGPHAVAGVSCARSINEDSYNMQKLFRSVFKTNNIDHCART